LYVPDFLKSRHYLVAEVVLSAFQDPPKGAALASAPLSIARFFHSGTSFFSSFSCECPCCDLKREGDDRLNTTVEMGLSVYLVLMRVLLLFLLVVVSMFMLVTVVLLLVIVTMLVPLVVFFLMFVTVAMTMIMGLVGAGDFLVIVAMLMLVLVLMLVIMGLISAAVLFMIVAMAMLVLVGVFHFDVVVGSVVPMVGSAALVSVVVRVFVIIRMLDPGLPPLQFVA